MFTAYNPYFTRRQLKLQPQARQHQQDVPAVIKVVNVISDIGHGAQKVARKAAKDAEPIIRGSAAQWRKTVGKTGEPQKCRTSSLSLIYT